MKLLKLLFLLLLAVPCLAQDLHPSAYIGRPGVVTVRGGKVLGATGGVTTIAGVDITPANSATTFIFIDLSGTPVVSSNTTGFPASNYFPICTVIKDANGVITSFTDNRPDSFMAGGGSTFLSGSLIDVTQAGNAGTQGAKADAFIGNDGVTTASSATFSSAARNCNPADNGKLVLVVNGAAAGGASPTYPYGTGTVTQTGCSGNNYTLSVTTAYGNTTGGNWAIGTDNNPSGCTSASAVCLNAAWQTALAANPGKGIALPCGALMFSSAPFTNVNSMAQFSDRGNLLGCNYSDNTTLIIHPNVVALLTTGGSVIWQLPSVYSGFGTGVSGINCNQKVANFMVTSLNGLLPGTTSQTYTLFTTACIARDIEVQLTGGTGTSTSWVVFSNSGEGDYERLNLQNFNTNGALWTGVSNSGQGVNAITGSVMAFAALIPSSCNTAVCSYTNDYFTLTSGDIKCVVAPCTINVIASLISCNPGFAQVACLDDTGQQTQFNIFASTISEVTVANDGALRLNSALSVADVSATTFSSFTSGFNVVGVAGSQFNDRAGNIFGNPLTQFSGKYVPIGGGSVANNSQSATTNFGVNLGATNVLGGVSPSGATYDVKIGFRQVTAGVGCGAGSNTVNGVLSWTSGGVTQSTGSGGVPALPTLTISANGSVGSSSAYQSQPVHIDINTQVTFTTTSVLASVGCTTTPQYVVDSSNI